MKHCTILLAVLLALSTSCQPGESLPECDSDADCRAWLGHVDDPFLNAENATCKQDGDFRYCSECDDDNDCPEGATCNRERSCYDPELYKKPSDVGSDDGGTPQD